MTMAELLQLLNEFWVLFSALGFALGWIAIDLLRSRFVTRKACVECRADLEARQIKLETTHKDIESRQYSQELALTALGTRLDALPTADTVNSLNLKLTELMGGINTLGEKMNGQANSIRRLETHLDTIVASYVEARE